MLSDYKLPLGICRGCFGATRRKNGQGGFICSNCSAKQKTQAYNELNKNNVHWSRINNKSIIVYMSSDGNGSHHDNLDIVTAFLSKAGFFEFERDFDRQCGKGFCIYKEIK